MSDKGTIRIPRDKFDHHNQRRKELGLTWAEYIDGEAPDVPEGMDVEEVAAAVVADLRASLPSDVADEVENRLR